MPTEEEMDEARALEILNEDAKDARIDKLTEQHRHFAERLRFYAEWIERSYGSLPIDRPPGPPILLVASMMEEADRLAPRT